MKQFEHRFAMPSTALRPLLLPVCACCSSCSGQTCRYCVCRANRSGSKGKSGVRGKKDRRRRSTVEDETAVPWELLCRGGDVSVRWRRAWAVVESRLSASGVSEALPTSQWKLEVESFGRVWPVSNGSQLQMYSTLYLARPE